MWMQPEFVAQRHEIMGTRHTSFLSPSYACGHKSEVVAVTQHINLKCRQNGSCGRIKAAFKNLLKKTKLSLSVSPQLQLECLNDESLPWFLENWIDIRPNCGLEYSTSSGVGKETQWTRLPSHTNSEYEVISVTLSQLECANMKWYTFIGNSIF